MPSPVQAHESRTDPRALNWGSFQISRIEKVLRASLEFQLSSPDASDSGGEKRVYL